NTSNKGVTWTSSNTGIATVSSSGLVTAKAAGTATITVKTSDGSNKSVTCSITVQYPAPAVSGSSTGSHTATTITYNWDQINKIAQAIANASGVNSSTTEVTATINGSSYKIGVGDIATVQYNGTNVRVRVLGFKHDDLVNTGAYGGNHSKASISFEFLDFMTGSTYKYMNSNNTNSGGWAAAQMRKDLNGYSNNNATQSGAIGGLGANLSNKSYIKQVKKKYNSNNESISTCNDFLWLLAASEIWTKGSSAAEPSGAKYGYSKIAEGNQYQYYKGVVTGAAQNTNLVKKTTASGSKISWWLRSLNCYGAGNFCMVNSDGSADCSYANSKMGVAPGFCI
ncbi:MAG: Ig-like domain-containing protein, partial [Clostridia bacterium]|nr:Ig-like domain-containing protein [Clostridia bacterium]